MKLRTALLGMGIAMLTTALPAGAGAAPGLKGLFRLLTDGTYAYESDVYRVVFDRNGQMTSLKVRGTEFLRPVRGESGGAGFFRDGKRIPLPSIQPNADGGLIADGYQGVFLHMTADRLDIDVGQETQGARMEYVFFPADGIRMEAVQNPKMRGTRNEKWQILSGNATRWTAPDGTSIELQYDTHLATAYNGAPAMPVNVPYKTRICGEVRFPASAWQAGQARLEWQGATEDHVFLKGQPVALTGKLTWIAPPAGADKLELVAEFEDMNLCAPVHQVRQPLLAKAGEPVPFSFSVPWDKPGPWRLHVLAVQGDRVLGIRTGVIVYDLEAYRPPLARPVDFWTFWEKALTTQRSLPLDAVLLKDDAASTPVYDVYTVYITGYLGRRLQGKYAEPAAPGRYPVTFGAGHPGANVSAPKEGLVCNVVTAMDGMATYRTGLGNRYTSNLFYNYMDALRWVDFVATREKADLARSIYYAGSRSGPVGLAILALDPRVRMYIANVPTNNRWDWQVTLPGAGGWGPWASDRLPGQTLDEFARELSYFNSDNFAERVTQPVLIGFGLLDGLSQVTGNLACHTRLASAKKKICFRAWWGHADATPEWYAISAAWRLELFGPEATPAPVAAPVPVPK